jgi:hypothetical protein
MVNRTMQQTTTLTLFTNSITNDILLLFWCLVLNNW